MLAVWGAHDEIFGPDGARAFQRDLPDAEIHLLDAGHFALETQRRRDRGADARLPRAGRSRARPVADGRRGGHGKLPRALAAFLAVACGLAVSNVYYAQPLLDAIAASFGVGEGSIGSVVTAAQLGYALGLVLIVPLGDMLEPRRLILALLAAVRRRPGRGRAGPFHAALLAACSCSGCPRWSSR